MKENDMLEIKEDIGAVKVGDEPTEIEETRIDIDALNRELDSIESPSDEDYMRICLSLAERAQMVDEVPVGAVAVRNGRIISAAFNTRETTRCATHHAEILAIEGACRALGGWRLPGVTLYVTMEPCAMCAGAIVNARIPCVVFGAYDLRFGAFGSLLDLSALPLNHRPTVRGDVLGDEARDALGAYFRHKRLKGKKRTESGGVANC